MISTIYWMKEAGLASKSIGTMARPRGNDWLEDEIRNLSYDKVDFLVSLLESSEAYALGLDKEGEYCQNYGISFINFPIPDVSTPGQEDDFVSLAKKLGQEVKNGKSVVIHCRMGIGRSSMLAAAILIHLGRKSSNIFERISTYRGLNVPDTPAQAAWIAQLVPKLEGMD